MQQIVFPGPDGSLLNASSTTTETAPKPVKTPAELPPERRPASWIMTAYKV